MKMAEGKSEPPRHLSYFRQAKDLALGVHPWSKYVPPLLLFLDALLCSLIISKVACEFLPPFRGGL
jgi:alpha-1,3-mannosyltransferase